MFPNKRGPEVEQLQMRIDDVFFLDRYILFVTQKKTQINMYIDNMHFVSIVGTMVGEQWWVNCGGPVKIISSLSWQPCWTRVDHNHACDQFSMVLKYPHSKWLKEGCRFSFLDIGSPQTGSCILSYRGLPIYGFSVFMGKIDAGAVTFTRFTRHFFLLPSSFAPCGFRCHLRAQIQLTRKWWRSDDCDMWCEIVIFWTACGISLRRNLGVKITFFCHNFHSNGGVLFPLRCRLLYWFSEENLKPLCESLLFFYNHYYFLSPRKNVHHFSENYPADNGNLIVYSLLCVMQLCTTA